MCGIIGSYEPQRRRARPFDEADRQRMVVARDRMTPRGPDSAGLWNDDVAMLGHRRLAILDPTDAGDQPMVGESGAVLTFNGEIYNYVELRDDLRKDGIALRSTGDSAVLLAAYERWGLAATLQRIRGMFAFAIWDPTTEQLHLARDPVGKKPLYFAGVGPGVAFASSIDALRAWLPNGADLRVDPVAVEHMLVGGYIPAPRTIYHGVEKLAAGTWLTVHADGKRDGGRHYEAPIGTGDRPLNRATIDDLADLFELSVRRRLRSDVPVATFLSGGLDSSLVTAAAAKLSPGITAYTVRTGHDNDDEFALACAIAKHTGVKHRIVSLPPINGDTAERLVDAWPEPFGDSSMLPSWGLASVTGQDFRVVLTGDGGDELHGGYRNSRTFAVRRWARRFAPDSALDGLLRGAADSRGLTGRVAFKATRLLASPATAAGLQHDRLDTVVRQFIDARHHRALDRCGWTAEWTRRFMASPTADELERMQAADFSVYLPDDLLMKVDGATMAHSLEARAPLLDRDFVDAAWNVRTDHRTRPWASKRIIRALYARHLPDNLMMKRKHGFSVSVPRLLDNQAVRDRLMAADRQVLPGLEGIFSPGVFGRALKSPGLAGPDGGLLVFRLWLLATWAARQGTTT